MPRALKIDNGIAWHCQKCGTVSIDTVPPEPDEFSFDQIVAGLNAGPGRRMGEGMSAVGPEGPPLDLLVSPQQALRPLLDMSDEAAEQWFDTAASELDGATPNEAIAAGRFPDVYALLT